jgi:ABC-type cobalamin transport system ATPase subunit
VHVARTASILRTVAENGAAVIVASHDLAQARAMADRAVLLGPGGVVMSQGSARETLTPERLEQLFGVPFALARSDGGTTIAPTSQMTQGV